MWRKLAGALALTLAAAGPAAAAWYDDLPAKALYEAAKQEGEVMVWGTAAIEVDWIPAAFAAQFPGVAVKTLGDNDVATKAIAEARGGRHEIDVFLTSYTAGRALLARDMFAAVDWSPFGLGPDDIAFGGKAALTHNLVYAVIFNRTLVAPADRPKQWTDLLDPRYRNRMVASSFLLPRLIGALGLAWGEDRMLQFARAMMQESGILLTRAPPENFLQSGERHYAVANFESQGKTWAARGLPVDFVIPQPAVVPQFYTAVMDHAPHPDAARLLAGFLATPEGKRAGEAANHEGDYRKGSANPLARELNAPDATVIPDRLEEMDKRDALIAKVNAIVAGQAR